MLFVALLIAAVCAKEFTVDLTVADNPGTKILRNEAQLELLYQRNYKKLNKAYRMQTTTDLGLDILQDKFLKEDVDGVQVFSNEYVSKWGPFNESDVKFAAVTKKLFENFQTPADDFNCRIAENERLCTAQAKNFPTTFATSFSAKAWEEIEKIDEPVLKTFKDAVKITEKVTTDTKEADLEKYALEGCRLAQFRAHFKKHAAHDDHKNSVATFGLTAILAAATLAF